MEKEKEERRVRAKDKGKAKAETQKEARRTSSSDSLDTDFSEGVEQAQKIQAQKQGQKKLTHKAPVKFPSKTQSGTKGKGKRPFGISNASSVWDATIVC